MEMMMRSIQMTPIRMEMMMRSIQMALTMKVHQFYMMILTMMKAMMMKKNHQHQSIFNFHNHTITLTSSLTSICVMMLY